MRSRVDTDTTTVRKQRVHTNKQTNKNSKKSAEKRAGSGRTIKAKVKNMQ